MSKRMISLCMALALLLCLLPAAPTAAAAGGVNINRTNFPDDAFRAYVREELDQNGDGGLSAAEIADVTWINCSNRGITSLKGIEFFTGLTSLNCGRNQLTALDVSQNTALTELACSNDQLTSLDVSQNTALENLFCSNNQLTSLDVSQNTALRQLGFDHNQLTTLNVSQNTALEILYAYSNQLTSLNVSGCTVLTTLYCHNNQLTSLDVSKNTALRELYCFSNQLTSMDVSQNTALQTLSCYDNQLTSLDVSKNAALKWLSCFDNQLTALEVSQTRALQSLNCNDNQLTELDVSQNTVLYDLYCDGNQLTSLDVRQNTALKRLHCCNNQMTTLYVSGLADLECSNNHLTALDLSQNTNLQWLDCSNNQLAALDVSQNTALYTLYCYNNQLTALDVSDTQRLWHLACYGNQLDVLDVSAVPTLLRALENGTKTVHMEEGVIQFKTNSGQTVLIEMDLGQKTIPASNPFLDVSGDDYYDEAVSWAYQNGIASGTGNNTFSPDKTCTREQVVTFLWRAFGCPEPTITANPFRDVPNYAYYAKAVLWALEQGITTGKSRTKFGVGDPCTRAQAVTFLWRAEGNPEPSSCQNPFTDVSETSYFYTAVLWALAKGVTRGTSASTFSPSKTCTRGEVVTFLYRDLAE